MLPSNFTQLEYIESSGEQYFNSRVVPKSETRVVMDIHPESITSIKAAFGCRNASSATASLAFMAWISKSTTLRSDYFGTSGTSDGTFDVRMTIDKNRNVCTANGVTVTNTATSGKEANLDLFLLACNNYGTANYFIAAKLYSCQIYDNDMLVRDFVPCKNAAGEVGLWDDVNREFYGNAGTGTFAAGPVAPQEMAESDIVELEYIESTGTQHIDTLFIPNQDTRVVCDCDYIATSSASWLFGVRVASGQAAFAFLAYGNKFRTDYNNSYTLYFDASTTEVTHVDKAKHVTTVNSSETISDTYATFDSKYSLFLLAINTAGTASGYSTAKIKACQIYDNGTLVRDFIPAKTVAGEIGLYDKVFKQFYRNAGSGVFTAGPEILVEPPVVPENFRMVRASGTAISLAWDAVENAASYQLDQNGARVLDANVTSYTASGLSRETEYTFSLTAVNRGGASEAATLTAKTTALVLIADRTQSDVAARNAKGTYGAIDLIRVGDAVSYLQGLLEQLGHLVPVEPKVDWTEYDWPTPSTMQRYLQDVETVRSKLTLLSSTPKTPDNMEYLTHTKANDIEQILLDVDAVISVLKKTVVPCGAATCGGDYL